MMMGDDGAAAHADEGGSGMERPTDGDPGPGGGLDLDIEGMPVATRDAGPDIFSPIDPDAPVSGHQPIAPPTGLVASLAPEHDWAAAAEHVFPSLRPVGTVGVTADELVEAIRTPGKSHTQPLVDRGPCGIVVVYALAAEGFDILVNGDHLLSWAVEPADVKRAAMDNLARWSATAPWTDEISGERRLLSSDCGDGWDAARILLPEVRAHLAEELGGGGVLVGLPERHLLLAGTMRAGDDEFVELFRTFVVEHSGDADEPIDRRVFELRGGELAEFATP